MDFFINIFKVDKTITAFDKTEIEKHKLYCHKIPILRDDVDFAKILISKYFFS